MDSFSFLSLAHVGAEKPITVIATAAASPVLILSELLKFILPSPGELFLLGFSLA
ncbi:hypothetical protein [Nitrincola sp. MINF-07-Sa-05]|uniref:hypothetical protein n=1 Tax=Nitrincola salilacus TaxID=3400273 RepID=UPI003917C881